MSTILKSLCTLIALLLVVFFAFKDAANRIPVCVESVPATIIKIEKRRKGRGSIFVQADRSKRIYEFYYTRPTEDLIGKSHPICIKQIWVDIKE